MNCPYCGAEMEKGLVQSAGEIFWSTERRKFIVSARETKGDIMISSYDIFGNFAESYLCRNCKKIITNYNE